MLVDLYPALWKFDGTGNMQTRSLSTASQGRKTSIAFVVMALGFGLITGRSYAADPPAKVKVIPPAVKPGFNPVEIQKVETSEAGSSAKSKRIGEDWPQFLGLRGTGISGETGLLARWPSGGPPVAWSLRVGTGYSAPSVRGNLVVLFHRQGDEEVVEAFQADSGEFVWRHAYPTAYEDPYGYNNGPRCTPLLTQTHCYTFGAEGRLSCLELSTGNRIWMRDTAADFNIPMAFFGVGSTPILEGNLLIVMVGGQPNSGMVAFDAESGKTIWQNVGLKSWAEPETRYHRDDKLASYSTPLAATIHGKRHLLCLMRPGLVSLDPKTGTTNFSHFFRSTLRDSVNAARPVVVGDEVFLSAAYDVGAVLLKVHADGKGADTVWQDELAMQNHWSTSIYHNGYLYGFSGRHEAGSTFRCIEFKTGKVKWQTVDVNANDVPDPKDGRGATPPKFYGRGSAVLADGKFIVLGEQGTLALVEINPEKFVEISRVKFTQMKYPSWTAPVLSRKRLYLRDEDHLMCIDLAPK